MHTVGVRVMVHTFTNGERGGGVSNDPHQNIILHAPPATPPPIKKLQKIKYLQ